MGGMAMHGVETSTTAYVNRKTVYMACGRER